jgi:hypothetical protein
MALTLKTSRKKVGAGRLFFQETDALGVPIATGEDYLGDSPGFSLTIANQSLEDFSSDGPLSTLDVNVATQITRTFALQTKDISFANMSRFLIGDVSQVAQTATPVVDEPHAAVRQGTVLQLGVSTTRPVGVRGVTSVSVTDDSGTPVTFALTADYEVDAETGRIYIVPGGSITDGTNLLISYTPPATGYTQISATNSAPKFGRLRYVEDATFGPADDVFAPFVQLKPEGDLAFKSRDAVQQMGWSVSVLNPPDGSAALYISGRAV